MPLTELHIRNIRNIASIELELQQGINVFFGANGSGKTTLLEAIYFLGTGKSFRTHRLEKLIRKGEAECVVFARVTEAEKAFTLGIRKTRNGIEVKKNQKNIKNRSILAASLPLVIITPTSHALLEGGPQWRRRFLDWGLFHVEPSFASDWIRYQRLLKQRNSLLTHADGLDEKELAVWDRAFIEAAEAVTQARERYVRALKPFVDNLLQRFSFPDDFSMRYLPGFAGTDFEAQLKRLLAKEKILGRTEAGPHRADVRFSFAGTDVRQWISRGQQKLLIYILVLAQNRYLCSASDRQPVLLLDDLAAELDKAHLDSILRLLKEEFSQIMITTADKELLPKDMLAAAALFHVEQGQVQIQ